MRERTKIADDVSKRYIESSVPLKFFVDMAEKKFKRLNRKRYKAKKQNKSG